MPKVTLEFNLPEDLEDYTLAMNGAQAQFTIDDFDNELRAHIKYDKYPEWHTETVESIRTLLHQLKNERLS